LDCSMRYIIEKPALKIRLVHTTKRETKAKTVCGISLLDIRKRPIHF